MDEIGDVLEVRAADGAMVRWIDQQYNQHFGGEELEEEIMRKHLDDD